MADDENGQEKTEEATSRRLEKSREEGQIPRSRELSNTVLMVASCVALSVFGRSMNEQMQAIFNRNFSISRADIFDINAPLAYLGASFKDAIWLVLPMFAVLFIAVTLSTLIIGGWIYSPKTIAPKMERMSLFKGLKRMFSVKALMEMVKALLKFFLILGISLIVLSMIKNEIMAIGTATLYGAMARSLDTMLWVSFVLSLSTILIVLIDVPFQLFQHSKQLKMTLQEIKDEQKDTEGKPEIKSKIRQLQREMAQSRMMGKVQEADVVITNPTHYSVALSYDPLRPGAPIVLAKGVDFIALKIREVAVANAVLIVEAPPLARAIYYTTEIDAEIPTELYVAIAQVLAYVYQLRKYKEGKGKRPSPLGDVDVPPDMQYEE